MLRQSNKKWVRLSFLPEEGSAGTDHGLVAGEIKMKRGPWKAPHVSPEQTGRRPASVGASQPTWRTRSRKAGWGGQPRRTWTQGPAVSHCHDCAAEQYEPGFSTGMGSFWESPPRPRGDRAELGSRLVWTPTSHHGEMALSLREEPSVR